MGQGIGTIVSLLAALLIGGAALVLWIRRKVRQVSRAAFGTDSIAEGIRRQEERLALVPKSVSGMTGIYLPQLQRDFPEVSLEELVQKSENLLKGMLAAVELQDLSLLPNASEDLYSQVRLRIEDDKRQGIREYFHRMRIHRTEISRYQKQEGCCVLTLQSAVEYEYGTETALSDIPAKRSIQQQKNGQRRLMTQTRYEMDWMYVQDASLVQMKGNAAAVTCPQCGAPVTKLGSKYCEYCGSAVEPVNIRVWSLNRIREC